MTSQPLLRHKDHLRELDPEPIHVAEPSVEPKSFDSKYWRDYFEENRKLRPTLKLPYEIVLDEVVHEPLLRSLQRFQLGETGDGHHLRKFAKRIGDRDYIQSIDLFVREEQHHAQILGQVILAMNGTLLNWHWSDIAFVILRRVLHLKTELLILLIAEVIGKCFYKCVADKINNENLEEVFSLIVLDEILHIEFHTEFLADNLKSYPWAVRHTVHYVWCLVFYTACFAFVSDHKSALAALNVSTGEFIETCSKIFFRSSTRALSLR